MRLLSLEEIRAIQLQILKKTVEFCEAEGITYYLAYGSLIGAVRHKGYIPWDDDIDIAMKRCEYERFVFAFQDEANQYAVLSISKYPSFPYPLAKVIANGTVLIEDIGAGQEIRTAVNIDVFPLDNVPDDPKKLKRLLRRRDRYRRLDNLKRIPPSSSNFFNKSIQFILHTFLKVYPENYFIQLISKNAQKYNRIDTQRIGCLLGYIVDATPKDCFAATTDVEFEGMKVKTAIGYDEWLRNEHGDYMHLPPPEKRRSHHTYAAYME